MSNRKFFQPYDIRGLSNELSPDFFYSLGLSTAQAFPNTKKVWVGRDGRLTSPLYASALIRGLEEVKISVESVGVVETPMFNIMSAGEPRLDLAFMITASHNPKEYNGCKIFSPRTALPLGLGSGLEKFLENLKDEKSPSDLKNSPNDTRIISSQYHDLVLKTFVEKIGPTDFSNLTIVVDYGHGAAATDGKNFFSRAGLKEIPLFDKTDGHFPIRDPNPLTKDTLKHLQEKIKQNKADFGVAYDGDGDRVCFVDNNGGIISGDIATALLYTALGKKNSKVILDMRSGLDAIHTIEKNLGQPILSEVGHTNIIHKMKDTEAVLAGELSCHYYFADFFNSESSEYAILLMANLIKNTGQTLDELVKEIQKYHNSGELNFKVTNPEQVIKKIATHYKELNGQAQYFDGWRINFLDWWFAIRQSHTEPVIRLVIEASSEERLVEKKAEIISKIEPFVS